MIVAHRLLHASFEREADNELRRGDLPVIIHVILWGELVIRTDDNLELGHGDVECVLEDSNEQESVVLDSKMNE